MPVELLKCPHCAHLQDIDPAKSLEPFTCNGCGRAASLGSWRSPATSREYLAINRETSIAFTQELYGHTVAFTLLADGGGVGTGTVVAIGDQILVATAYHNLPERQKSLGLDGAIGLVAKDRIVEGDRSKWIVRCESNRILDIGIVELTPHAASELNLVPVGLERIHDAGRGHPLCKARVIGYPAKFLQDHFPQQGIRGFRALSYGTEILDIEAWDELHVSDLYPDEHAILIYDQEDNIDWLGDFVIETTAPHPSGMSGGGIWQATAPLDDTHLWTIDRLRLVAIETGWFENYSVLKGTQIIYWLKLVSEKYPHLRDRLEASFPRLRQLT